MTFGQARQRAAREFNKLEPNTQALLLQDADLWGELDFDLGDIPVRCFPTFDRSTMSARAIFQPFCG